MVADIPVAVSGILFYKVSLVCLCIVILIQLTTKYLIIRKFHRNYRHNILHLFIDFVFYIRLHLAPYTYETTLLLSLLFHTAWAIARGKGAEYAVYRE